MLSTNQKDEVANFDKYVISKTHKTINKSLDKYELKIYLDKDNRKIGVKSSLNYWKIFKYDDSGNKILEEDSDGNWEKRKYVNKKIIRYANSLGTYWEKKFN